MRDTVTAPGLSGEASGCGGVVDTTGVALGPHWARDGRPAGPAEPAGFQFRARSPLFRSPLADAVLVEQFADVFPCLLGSSPVVVAPDWVPAVVALVWGIALYLGSPDGSVLLRSFPSPAAWVSGLYYNCARFSAIRITKRKLGGSSFMYGTLHLFFLPISAPSKRGTCRRRSDP